MVFVTSWCCVLCVCRSAGLCVDNDEYDSLCLTGLVGKTDLDSIIAVQHGKSFDKGMQMTEMPSVNQAL